MLTADRKEFDDHLASLCAGFNVPVGLRSEAYWLGLQKMELPTFVRVVQYALGEDGPEKIPTVSQCWAISKKLRAVRYVPPQEPASKWRGDHWDIEANHHLLNHLRKHPKKYAPDSTYDPIARQAVAGPLTKIYTEILVRWKKTWAEDMRAEINPDAAVKQSSWQDCISRADEQIREVRP